MRIVFHQLKLSVLVCKRSCQPMTLTSKLVTDVWVMIIKSQKNKNSYMIYFSFYVNGENFANVKSTLL